MTKKIFNPQEWLQDNEQKEIAAVTNTEVKETTTTQVQKEVEEIISRIEANSIDIATAYSDWRDIGFAFASEFGEQGRDYFHRISRYYTDYSTLECDKQFDKCLKANGSGVTLKTFFHKAKSAGINIAVKSNQPINDDVLPLIPPSVFENLPTFLQEICNITDLADEKDILLLGSIVTLSSCVPNVFGYYHNRKVFANLFLFITAQASAGKGMLTHCTRLVNPIQKRLRDESLLLKSQYERDYNDYQAIKKANPAAEKPQRPPEKMLFIPANNSASGVLQLLNDNNGKGLIFETEGDTLAYAFKSDYGNYSDAFRKAFHHETIRYYRKTDREFVDLEQPCLSAVLSGTPKQVQNLIPDAENGLFSRFMFYYLQMSSVWKDVFERKTENGLDEYFDVFGSRYYELFKELNSSINIEFTLTVSQQNQFNNTFEHWQTKYETLLGFEYNATVRRLGLITFRMAMIFSVLRILETGDLSRRIVCEERDFQNAIAITEVLVIHAKKVFSELPQTVVAPKRENREERFFNLLPQTFTRKDYVSIAEKLEIPDKTAQNYIAKYLKKSMIHRDKQDFYIKSLIKETKDLGEC
jgi:hypothetical protein